MTLRVPSLLLRSASAVALAARGRERLPDGRAKPQVLVLGVYLADRANTIEHLVAELAASRTCVVDQKWVALRGGPPSPAVAAVTVRNAPERMAKFTFLNYLCATTAWRHYDYLLLVDDDIRLQSEFVDRFVELVRRFDFALAQPARTPNSYIDHAITVQVEGCLARETRFVEIGPVVCLRRDFARLVVPFDEGAPMGWGLDLVWPQVAGEHGLRLGIVDSTPVDHSMRQPAAAYDGSVTGKLMREYLRKRRHLRSEEAQVIVATYSG